MSEEFIEVKSLLHHTDVLVFYLF